MADSDNRQAVRVYLLWEVNDLFHEDYEERLIGVYSSEAAAKENAKFPVISDPSEERHAQPWSCYVEAVEVKGNQ